jgi:hypothetical protein
LETASALQHASSWNGVAPRLLRRLEPTLSPGKLWSKSNSDLPPV